MAAIYSRTGWPHPDAGCWKRITDPATDELLVSYPDAPVLTHRLVFGREGGKRFDERERFLMKLLRPDVGPLLARTAAPRERPDVVLTDRQREVLRLVRVGMANKQIARAMKISTGTVRKHLDNIYERLGV